MLSIGILLYHDKQLFIQDQIVFGRMVTFALSKRPSASLNSSMSLLNLTPHSATSNSRRRTNVSKFEAAQPRCGFAVLEETSVTFKGPTSLQASSGHVQAFRTGSALPCSPNRTFDLGVDSFTLGLIYFNIVEAVEIENY